MSRTTADDKLDEAQEAIKTAEEALRRVVVDGCSGHDEFHDWWANELASFHSQLVHMRHRLTNVRN